MPVPFVRPLGLSKQADQRDPDLAIGAGVLALAFGVGEEPDSVSLIGQRASTPDVLAVGPPARLHHGTSAVCIY